jgi:FtsP/CotA-like multicopper oxidase with cupredoxin domain
MSWSRSLPTPLGSGLNVYAGLAGVYLIRDDEEDALGLPRGEHELMLLIQDRSFADGGSLSYPVSKLAGSPEHPGPWEPEFFGDTILVNGKIWPFCEVEPRKYRLRIINGSNARFYGLRWSDRRPFIQIGSDQGLLAAPVEVDHILLAPAERVDATVDFRGARSRAIRRAAMPFSRRKCQSAASATGSSSSYPLPGGALLAAKKVPPRKIRPGKREGTNPRMGKCEGPAHNRVKIASSKLVML